MSHVCHDGAATLLSSKVRSPNSHLLTTMTTVLQNSGFEPRRGEKRWYALKRALWEPGTQKALFVNRDLERLLPWLIPKLWNIATAT